MRNRNIKPTLRGFEQDRHLDELLVSESKRHRPVFSEGLHDRIVQSIEMRRDGHTSAAPIETDDVLPLWGRSLASLPAYALVAAAACLVAALFISRPAPDIEPTGPVNMPAIVAGMDQDVDQGMDQDMEQDMPQNMEQDEPQDESVVPAASPEALADVIELTAAEVSSLASVATSEYWIESAIELQQAFDQNLQQLASSSDFGDE